MENDWPEIDETVFLHTHMAIPLRSKSKLVFPLDTIIQGYLFKDKDKRNLLKYCDHENLTYTLMRLKLENSLNPLKNHPYAFQITVYCLMIFLFCVFLYPGLLLIVIFVYNPVVLLSVIACYFKVWKKWYATSLILIEKRKLKDLRKFLEQENNRYYLEKNVVWSLGNSGKWIQLDIKKGLIAKRSSPVKSISKVKKPK